MISRSARPEWVTTADILTAAVGWVGCRQGSPVPAASGPPPVAGPGTAAIARVEADQIDDIPAVRFEALLEGRVAGLQVLRSPGGGISIRIRGPGTILGSSEPLYVVDGMAVHVSPGQGLDWLSPGDIESVEILKDAAATSLYGMRGGNGVVVITTRRGR